jgi:hypothetical protein
MVPFALFGAVLWMRRRNHRQQAAAAAAEPAVALNAGPALPVLAVEPAAA